MAKCITVLLYIMIFYFVSQPETNYTIIRVYYSSGYIYSYPWHCMKYIFRLSSNALLKNSCKHILINTNNYIVTNKYLRQAFKAAKQQEILQLWPWICKIFDYGIKFYTSLELYDGK